MQKHEDNLVRPSSGGILEALVGATVSVINQATGLAPLLYSDNGVTQITTVIVTDSLGYYNFYAADGRYTITYTGSTFVTFTREIILEDPADGIDALKASGGSDLVGHIAAGTGAVGTTLGNKLRRELSSPFDRMTEASRLDVISMAMITDVTAYLQSAVDNLPASGGVIRLPKGVYKFSRIDILNKSNVSFVSELMFSGSYNSTNYGTTLISTNTGGPGLYFSNGVGVGCFGVQIKGAAIGIQFDSCLGFRVYGCNLRENGIGIQGYGNGVGTIRDNMIRSNTGPGIKLTQSSGDTLITGNDIGANVGGNILVSTGNVRIVNNHIFSSKNAGAGRGIIIDATQASTDNVIRCVEISGNLIANSDMQVQIIGTALGDRDVQDIQIHHNHIHQADDGGESFDSGFAYGQGISVLNAKRVHIDHNNFIGLRDYAVKATNCLEGMYIDHNHFRAGNAAGVIFDLVQWGNVDNNEFVSNVGTAMQVTCTTGGNFSQNNRFGDNSFQSNGAVYTEDANSRANWVYDNLGGVLSDYSLSATAPPTQIRHISQAGAQVTTKNQNMFMDGLWNGSHLIQGSYHYWTDATGKLRSKSSAPTTDLDGAVVGTQT